MKTKRTRYIPRSRSLALAVSVVTAFCLMERPALGQSQQGKDLLIGVWELDLSKSDFTPETAIRVRTMVFSPVDNGVACKITTTTERGNGRVTTDSSYTARYDNKDVPIDSPSLDTVALRKIDANTYERTGKIRGKAVETASMKVSMDGKILIVTTTGSIDGQDYSSTQEFVRQ